MKKIRFNYREGKEKYTAEEWIVDKYALNKAQTKLVRGLAKWRRKTVNFVDDLALGAAEALSASTAKKAAETEQPEAKKEEKSAVSSGPIVITPKAEVEVKTPAETAKATVVPATPLTPATPVASGTMPGYKEVAPDQLPTNAIQMGAGKLVLVIGTDAFNMTMMTANAGWVIGQILR